MAKRKKETGLCQVYIRHSEGFHGRLRPAYDSASDALGEMTDSEVSTLRAIINRYVAKCHKRHGTGKILIPA